MLGNVLLSRICCYRCAGCFTFVQARLPRVSSSTAGTAGGDPSWGFGIPWPFCTGCRTGYDFFLFLCITQNPAQRSNVKRSVKLRASQIKAQDVSWDHQETTRVRVAVLATQAGKSQVSMEMWSKCWMGQAVAGLQEQTSEATETNIVLIFGKSQAGLIWGSYSRGWCGYGSCIGQHLSLWLRAPSGSAVQDEFDETSLFDGAPGPTLAGCQALQDLLHMIKNHIDI